jgi:glutaredoxin 3
MADGFAAKVTIYTTQYCGYCFAAKRLLDKKGAAYEEIRCDDRDDLRAWLESVSGQRTVPQIFINGESIGGYDELSGLHKAARLDAMLATPPSVDNPPLRS